MTPEKLAERIAAEKRYNRRLWLGIVAFFLSAVIAIPVTWCYNAYRRWERLKAEYEAAGETLDPEKLRPPPVKNEDNLFAIPELLEREKYREVSVLVRRVGQIPSTRGSSGPRRWKAAPVCTGWCALQNLEHGSRPE